MAPEQLSGEGADGRSDLFSLGVILYAMVTGHSPFQGNSATTVCFKVANREPVPASALDLTLPSELDAVIARAMAKNPAQRYQRGAEFADAVRQLQALFQPGATATSRGAPSATAKRETARRHGLNGPPAVGLAYAAKFVRAAILKAPLKDLILGLATVVLLVIVGAQSKLLIGAQEEAVNVGQVRTQPVHPYQNQPDPLPSSQVQASAGTSAGANAKSGSSANSATATKAAVRKASVKASAKETGPPSPRPVKQVVVPLATINLAVQHQFRDATLTVWVDDKLVLTRPLHGGTQKRLVVFNGIRGVDSQTLQIPAGKHVFRVRALSADQTIDLSRTVAAEFIGGADKTLQVTIDKHNTVMKLNWGQ
jgi:serine/threonine-protein kinase